MENSVKMLVDFVVYMWKWEVNKLINITLYPLHELTMQWYFTKMCIFLQNMYMKTSLNFT